MKSPLTRYRFKQIGVSYLPVLAAALVPKCPLCWLAILGFLGLGPALSLAVWLEPLALALLGFTLGLLAFRSYRRKDYRPTLVGTAAAALIFVSKFRLDFDPGVFLGGALLLAAVVYSARRPVSAETAPTDCCGALAPARNIEKYEPATTDL